MHWQRVERVDDGERQLVLRERGPLYRRWDHRMWVSPISQDRRRFNEAIDIEAGPATVLAWLGGRVLCRSRVRRFRELAELLASRASFPRG